jgi:site-specific DNA-methyltransferase (adenine-specific)
MNQAIQCINSAQGDELSSLTDGSCDLVVISTGFEPKSKQQVRAAQTSQLADASVRLVRSCARVLRFGGLLFVYGPPAELIFWGEFLHGLHDAAQQMVFKYWIALDVDEAPRGQLLKATHQGLLLFHKTRADRKSPTPFRPDTNAIRVPHAYCAACRLNLKDWGGKKHLMNPRGAAPSDVWRDLPRRAIRDNVIPEDVLQRIRLLAGGDSANSLHVIQTGQGVESNLILTDASALAPGDSNADTFQELSHLETDRVFQGDCVAFLKRVKTLHPEGVFDLAFADPPYNLEKKYDSYADALAEQHYLEWCNAWLDGMAQTLKPGGSLLVLNLPKWAIHHATFLSGRLEFRHWIVWDALSDPRGKLMPAHYALLYFTKPGGRPVFNYSPVGAPARESLVGPPESPKYCLRAKCIMERKLVGDDEKVELSDIWVDIHRIKHKRDRDSHPCQLPEKLLERIILLTTRHGGVVFDPFCGAGTTAIAAAKLGRKFVVTDLDPNYVRITNEKLAAMRQNADLFGSYVVPRASVARPRGNGSKRGIELYLQQLARKLGRVPTETDVNADRPDILGQIDQIYPTRSAAFKRAKIVC